MQIANFHLLPLFLVFPGSAVSFSLPLFARVSAAPQAVSGEGNAPFGLQKAVTLKCGTDQIEEEGLQLGVP